MRIDLLTRAMASFQTSEIPNKSPGSLANQARAWPFISAAREDLDLCLVRSFL
jgi:hypothetical protein